MSNKQLTGSKIAAAVAIGLIVMVGSCTRALIKVSSEFRQPVSAETIPEPLKQAMASKTVTSKDGKVQISVPAYWVDMSQQAKRKSVTLKVGDRKQSLFVTLGSQTRIAGLTLEQLAEGGNTARKMLDSSTIERTDLKQVNRYPAVQHKIRGQKMGLEMIMLVTVVQTPSNFHVISVAAPVQSYEQNQLILQQMIQSLKEI